MKRMRFFRNSKRGDVSVKGLAVTVGAIVVIGAIVTWLAGGVLEDWIGEVWSQVWGWIQSTFMS